jgi:hypothetical protein
LRSLALALLASGIVPAALVAAEADAVSHFREQVAPILASRCIRCHQGKAPRGDLDLTRARSVVEGRGEGSVVVPGKPEVTAYFGRRCLAARRLLERGMRFVPVGMGNDNGFPRRNWDTHEDVERDHGALAPATARGASALIQDLEQRGLLDEAIGL